MSDKYYQEMEKVWAEAYPSVNGLEEVESFYRESGYEGGFTSYIQKMLDRPDLNFQKERLLEFGCDNGVMLNYFKGRSLELYGVDINRAAIENGRQLYPEFNLVISFGLEIPFKDKFFDLVFVSAVLKHIRYEDRAEIYQELGRIADFILVSELNSETDSVEEMGGFKFYHSNFIKELKANFEALDLVKIGNNFLSLYQVPG